MPDDQFEEAQQFLASDQPIIAHSGSENICPNCGSHEIADTLHKKRSYIMSFLILIVAMLPVPLIKERYKCTTCNHLWK